ncbi:GNAT family N-acetyltransferase, cg3035/Rv0428c family [Gordonia sp. CPCC 205333]|uniref:GNAT family N-acetyltransferase, cg3035/Rv0428c family n=1 Tax=Gordonia sp. CPCC 205333 TaxID=3140790 RepID=UPI003AF3D7C6
MTDRAIDSSDLYLGDRIVVRYRLDGRRLTDVTGLLRDAGDPLVIEGTGPKELGECISVSRREVTSVRLLSYMTVRNSEIRTVAESLARAATATFHLESGWLLRADAIAPLDNSALPVELGARADGVSLIPISRWYADRGLPTILALPERLIPDVHLVGTRVGPVMHVLVKPDNPAEAVAVDATDRASGENLRASGYRLHHVLRHLRLDTYGDG